MDKEIYRHVVEIGFVVSNWDRAVDYWEKLGLWHLQRMGTRELSGILYRGKEVPLTVKMARGNIGNARMTWIEPIKGTSDYSEFLERHGDGVHHLSFAAQSAEQLDAQVRYFNSKGVGVVMERKWPTPQGEARFADLDTAERGGGITLELLYDPDLQAHNAQPPQNEEPFNKLAQYALVVRDIRKVGAFYEDLGFEHTDREYIDYHNNPERYFRGKPAKFEIYVGTWHSGTVDFEWIEPAVGPSVFEEFLQKHGEGIQHLAADVTDIDAVLSDMKSKGAEVAQNGGFNYQNMKGRFAYVDIEPETGVMIEFVGYDT